MSLYDTISETVNDIKRHLETYSLYTFHSSK